MAQLNHTPRLLETEEALIVLFCLIDDAYAYLTPRAQRYESIKRLSDSEVITLALFQQLQPPGEPPQRSCLPDFADHSRLRGRCPRGRAYTRLVTPFVDYLLETLQAV